MRKSNPAPDKKRQSSLAILLMIATFAKNIFRQFWWIFLVMIFNPRRNSEISFLLILVVFSAFSLIGSILAYFRFYYQLTDTEFIVEQGIFRRKNTRIPFERIQAIRLEQNLIHQAFNITKLEVDTAGSKGSELSITAIGMAAAQEIREYIFALKKEKDLASETKSSEDLTLVIEPEHFENGEQIMTLPLNVLFKIGISENHLRTLGIILLFLMGLAERLTEFFMPQIDELIYEDMVIDGSDFWATILMAFMLLPVFLLISIGISVVQTAIKYADFVVYRTAEGLRIIGGLFTRIEQVVIKRKIQMVVLDTNPIRKLFKITRVRYFQASSTSLNVHESIIIPGCSPKQAHVMLTEYANPEYVTEAHFQRVHPSYGFRTFALTGMLPLIIISIVGYFRFGPVALWLLGLTPLIALFSYLHYQRLLYAISSELIVLKKGVFNRSTTVLKPYKIQSVELYRGFYELRKGLGTVVIHTAARQLSIPFLNLALARHLTDYLTMMVEKDKRHWL